MSDNVVIGINTRQFVVLISFTGEIAKDNVGDGGQQTDDNSDQSDDKHYIAKSSTAHEGMPIKL